MKTVLKVAWPVERETADDKRNREESQRTDVAKIRDATWSEPILEEARNLSALENERRRSADTKASIYLAVIAAIVPILSSLVTDLFGNGFAALPLAFHVTTVLLFAIGLAYLTASGVWAFRTLAVSVHHRVDIDELLSANEEPSKEAALTRELLLAARKNRDGVNQKTSFIKTAHELLLRTFVSFTALIAVIVFWAPLAAAAERTLHVLSKVFALACGT